MKQCTRLFALIMALILSVLLVACDGGTPEVPTSAETPATTTTTTATTTTTTVLDAGEEPTEPEEPLPPQIKNVILIIGDGMGMEHIAAAEMYYGEKYVFTGWQFASVKTNSLAAANSAVNLTDSAASATALATGTLTQNGYVGKDYNGRDLKTVMDYAKELGKSTGIVTTDYLHGATPSGFSAHCTDRNDSATISKSQAQSGVDFLCGTANDVTTAYRSAYENAGYTYFTSHTDMKDLAQYDRICASLPIEGYAENPRITLKGATKLALDFLEEDEDGFVLMIEQAHIDKYSHNNDIDGVLKQMRSLANTVDAVMEWIGEREDTVVIVTADHETGGLNVSGEYTLPHTYGTVGAGKRGFTYQFTTGNHSNANVGAFFYGAQIDFKSASYYQSNYMLKNIDIPDIIKGLLKPQAE